MIETQILPRKRKDIRDGEARTLSREPQNRSIERENERVSGREQVAIGRLVDWSPAPGRGLKRADAHSGWREKGNRERGNAKLKLENIRAPILKEKKKKLRDSILCLPPWFFKVKILYLPNDFSR